jgi:hypothetical protein
VRQSLESCTVLFSFTSFRILRSICLKKVLLKTAWNLL